MSFERDTRAEFETLPVVFIVGRAAVGSESGSEGDDLMILFDA
jgi:hypothetical protein